MKLLFILANIANEIYKRAGELKQTQTVGEQIHAYDSNPF